jgi:hypothetical protein
MRKTAIVNKYGVSCQTRFLLKGKGNEIPEPSAGKRILVREQPVIGGHRKLMPVGHRLRDEITTELPRHSCGYRRLEKEPDVGTIA